MDMSDPQHLPSYRRAGTNQMLSPWSPAPSSSRPRCLPRPPPHQSSASRTYRRTDSPITPPSPNLQVNPPQPPPSPAPSAAIKPHGPWLPVAGGGLCLLELFWLLR